MPYEENQKPIIDNTEGSKNPIEEVGKLEGFENLPPPVEPEKDNTDDQPVIEPEEKPSSNQTTDAPEDVQTENAQKAEKEKPFFSTAIGIITIIICVLVSLGILAFGVLLILKNKKAEKTE